MKNKLKNTTNKVRVNIGDSYAKTVWYEAWVSFPTEENDDTEEYNVTIEENWDDNSTSSTISIHFTDELPEGVDEDEIKQLIKDKFNEI